MVKTSGSLLTGLRQNPGCPGQLYGKNVWLAHDRIMVKVKPSGLLMAALW